MRIKLLSLRWLIVSTLGLYGMPSAALFANCIERPQGQIIKIEIQSCEAIVAEKNKEVRKYAGELYEKWNLKKAYTGALVKDTKGTLWMYPSEARSPCKEFSKKKTVEKRAYYTCCDTGRWGKCVFGGNWLGDINGKPINSFQ